MKYKFPKKITIGAYEWNMIYDKTKADGEFSYPWKGEKAFIRIGIRDIKADDGDFLNILIHELTEIIQCDMGTRYKPIDNATNYLFSYSHKEHTNYCYTLTGLLRNFIK
jgi:hypothetical protein